MSFRLVVTSLAEPGESRPVDFDQEVVLIGRRAGVDLLLPHPALGGVHLRLEQRDDGLFAMDAGAVAGTMLGGARLAPGNRHELVDGDELVLAGVFRLRVDLGLGDAAVTTIEGTAELARALVRDMLTALGDDAREAVPTLTVVDGPAAGRVLPVPEPGRDLVLGRGEACDACLPDPELSREHLRVRRTWSGAEIVDLGSKNGTALDGERLLPGSAVPLRDGARLTAGSSVLVYADPAEEYLASVTLRDPPLPRTTSGIAWLPVAVAGFLMAGALFVLVAVLRG